MDTKTEKPDNLKYCLLEACKKGNLTTVKYLVDETSIKIDEDVIAAARQHGHGEILLYLLEAKSLNNDSIETVVPLFW